MLGVGVLYQILSMSVLWNSIGIFFKPICDEFGFANGDFSIFSTIRYLAMAFAIVPMTNIFNRSSPRKTLSICFTLCMCSFALFSVSSKLWQIYLIGLAMGISGSIVFILPVSLMMNNWFKKSANMVQGISAAASGLGGIVMNPICSRLVVAMGWRSAILLVSAINLALILLLIIFLYKPDPAEVGEKPYGYDEATEEQTKRDSKAVPEYIFVICCIAMIGLILGGRYNNHFATIVQTRGFDLVVAGTAGSVMMFGNTLAKLAVGWLSDRLGVWRGLGIGTVLIVLTYIFMLNANTLAMIMIAAFFFGNVTGLGNVATSLICQELYSGSEYMLRMAKLRRMGEIIGAFGYAAIGYLYDFSNSYTSGFYICGAFTVLSVACFVFIPKRLKKIA